MICKNYSVEYREPVSKFTKFLWWCAGASIKILEECPSEKAKYQGVGAIVLVTAILATITGGYALFFIFNNIIVAVMFGLFWGLGVIFSLDRYIVATIEKRSTPLRQFLLAMPRLCLAFFIVIIIAKPLEITFLGNDSPPPIE